MLMWPSRLARTCVPGSCDALDVLGVLMAFFFFLKKIFFVPSLLSPNIIGKVLSLFCFPCILRRSFVHENGFFIGSENNYVGNNLLETGILQFLFNLRFFDDGDFTKSSYCD